MRYAQEHAGQRFHIVKEMDPDLHHGRNVSNVALCGRTCHRRGAWRITVNIPINVCRRCQRQWAQLRR